jgi:hypothetical protein
MLAGHPDIDIPPGYDGWWTFHNPTVIGSSA